MGPNGLERARAGSRTALPVGCFAADSTMRPTARHRPQPLAIAMLATRASCRLVERFAPIHEPAVALERVPPHFRVDKLSSRRRLGAARRVGEVSDGLDEQVLRCLLPAFVIPSRLDLSPLELSEDTTPSQAEKADALLNLNREKPSTPQASAIAVTVSTPLHAPRRVDGRLPPGGLGQLPDLGLQPPLLLGGRLDSAHVMLQDRGRSGLSHRHPLDSCSVRRRPDAQGPALRGPVGVAASVSQEELREALLRRRDLVAGVGRARERSREALQSSSGARLVDLVHGEPLGEELGVPPVGLHPLVGGGPRHLRHGADRAVNSECAQLAAEV